VIYRLVVLLLLGFRFEDPSVGRLTRALMARGREVVTRVPPQPTATLRQVTINSWSSQGLSANIQLGSNAVAGVSAMEHYTVPVAGDTAWAIVNGNDIVLVGKHRIATPAISP